MSASLLAASVPLPPRIHRARGQVTVALLVLATWLGMPGIAQAHGALKRSTPKAGASLDTIPRELRLEFSEQLELRLTKLVLAGSGGGIVALGTLAFGDNTRRVVLAAPTTELAPGRYEVRWQTAGADGHPTRGRFTFTIRPNAVRAAPPPPATLPRTGAAGTIILKSDSLVGAATTAGSEQLAPDEASFFNERSLAYVVVRWLQYLAVFLVVGAFVFTRVVLARAVAPSDAAVSFVAAARDRALRIGAGASVALIALQFARFLAQRTALQGSGDFAMEVAVADMLIGSPWGTGILLIVLGGGIASFGYRKMLASSGDASVPVAVALVAIAVGLGLSGHQAASPLGAPLAVGLNALHVLGTAGWLGTLALLVLTGLPIAAAVESFDHEQVAAILHVFSPVVLIAAAVAGATGLTLAAANVGSVPALWQSEYGRLLLVKLAVLSIVAGTGAYNWRRVLPTLGTPVATRALRRSASVEAVVAILVVAVTSVLVATPTEAMR